MVTGVSIVQFHISAAELSLVTPTLIPPDATMLFGRARSIPVDAVAPLICDTLACVVCRTVFDGINVTPGAFVLTCGTCQSHNAFISYYDDDFPGVS